MHYQAQQSEAVKRRQEQRKHSFQPPVEQKTAAVKLEGGGEGEGEGEGGGVGVEVGEVKRKVKEAMKRRKKKAGTH